VFSAANGNQIRISDVDNTSHTVTLTAAHGTITLNGMQGWRLPRVTVPQMPR